MDNLVEYYNKFNEDKRLLSRHGQVEYAVTRHYLDECLKTLSGDRETATNSDNSVISIADIGAGTGRYSLALAKEGYTVTAVEYVQYNLGILKKHMKEDGISFDAYKGDARHLKKLTDKAYDVTLLLGPMYHLHSDEDKVKALKEAMRLTKPGGYVLVAYVMADYAVVKYGFMEGHIGQSISKGALGDDYKVLSDENELYDYVRIEDIDRINRLSGATRDYIFAPDGAADYIRSYLNDMDDRNFELFIDYQVKNAKRQELLGASSHLVDVIRV